MSPYLPWYPTFPPAFAIGFLSGLATGLAALYAWAWRHM